MPVRAELHLYDDLQPHVQEAAIRQARLVLQERYFGGVPVPVRILEMFQVREEMLVRLPPLGARPTMSVPKIQIPVQWRPHAMIGAAVVALLILFWIGYAILGAGSDGEETPVVANTPEADSQASGAVTDAPAAAEGEEEPVSEEVAPPATNPGDFPVSRNARSDLGIGMRVQVVPGLRVALRSEPAADRGITVGEMGDGDIVTIVAGPEYTAGDSDTIVWWFVTLANGTQAWAAANTSQQTLLIPAP
jgi:hypothetical protein